MVAQGPLCWRGAPLQVLPLNQQISVKRMIQLKEKNQFLLRSLKNRNEQIWKNRSHFMLPPTFLQQTRVQSGFINVIYIYFVFLLLFQWRTCYVSVWMKVFRQWVCPHVRYNHILGSGVIVPDLSFCFQCVPWCHKKITDYVL